MTQRAEPHPSAPSQTVERRGVRDQGKAIWRGPRDIEGLQIHWNGDDTWRSILTYVLSVVIVLAFGWVTLNRVQFASKQIRVVLLPGRILGLLTSENFDITNWKITPGAIWPGLQGLSTPLNCNLTS